jgi:uncharacterized repeat protein (TIGR01451 family)/CSLREA domain-containing protein
MRRFSLILLLGLGLALPGQAATLTVDTANDEWDAVPDAECSLREAVESANRDEDFGGCVAVGIYGDDVIDLPAGTYGLTLGPAEPVFELDNSVGDLDVTTPGFFGPPPLARVGEPDRGLVVGGSVTILGAGTETTIIERQSAEVFGIFEIFPNTVVMEDLTIQGGEQELGGGIHAAVDLTLRRVVVRDNVARSEFPDGGGISNVGRLELTDTWITDNQVIVVAGVEGCDVGYGGGLSFENLGGGFFIGPFAESLIERTTISGNQVVVDPSCGVEEGFGFGGGAAIGNFAELRIVNSTVSGNNAPFSGGLDFELFSDGEGPEPISALKVGTPDGSARPARKPKSRFRSWAVAAPGGLDRGLVFPETTTSLEHVTITENSAEEIGGLGILSFDPGLEVVLENTLIGGNTAGDAPDCSNADSDSVVISQGTNLLSIDDPLDGEMVCLTQPPDLVGTLADPLEPLLGPLGDYGGETPTHSLLPGSPALDAAPDQGETEDQRGVARPQGAAFDIGAFEAVAVDLAITKTDSEDPVQRGTTFTYTVEVTNNGPGDAFDVEIQDSVPVELTPLSAVPSAGGTCDILLPPGIPFGGGAVTCTFAGPTAVGETRSVTLTVQMSPDVDPGSTVTNLASVSSSSPELDPDPSPNQVIETTTVAAADLLLTKSADNGPGTVTFTLTVTNLGPDEAVDVVIEDMLPAGLLFVSATPSAGGVCTTPAPGTESGTVTCTFAGPTGVGEMRTVTLDTATTDATTVGPNTATASSATGDPVPDPSPNVATAAVDVFVIPTLDEWGLLLLVTALAGAAVLFLRRG